MLSTMPPPSSLPPPWVIGFPHKLHYLEHALDRATKEIRIICYSFIIWKDRHEETFLKFLRNGGRLRVLMIHPESHGFLEKSAMEAYEKSQSGIGSNSCGGFSACSNNLAKTAFGTASLSSGIDRPPSAT